MPDIESFDIIILLDDNTTTQNPLITKIKRGKALIIVIFTMCYGMCNKYLHFRM